MFSQKLHSKELNCSLVLQLPHQTSFTVNLVMTSGQTVQSLDFTLNQCVLHWINVKSSDCSDWSVV